VICDSLESAVSQKRLFWVSNPLRTITAR
jgi:hypothetical protein